MADTDLAGKTVLVTGASSGIGEACARAFAPLGARLLLVARREGRLRALARELTRAHGVPVRAARLDVRDERAVARLVGSLRAPWSEIEVLVNNAGLSRGLEPVGDGLVSDWEEMIDTNVKGLLYVSRAVIPGMLRRGRGHVINLGSIAGHEVYPGGNVYCATKFAVRALTDGMRSDYYDTPLRFTLVSPGLVETEFSLVRFHGDRERARAPYRGMTPLSAADIADAIVWAATRPPHVNVGEIILLPTAQATATRVHRKEPAK